MVKCVSLMRCMQHNRYENTNVLLFSNRFKIALENITFAHHLMLCITIVMCSMSNLIPLFNLERS